MTQLQVLNACEIGGSITYCYQQWWDWASFECESNHEGNNKTNPECGTFYKITGLDA